MQTAPPQAITQFKLIQFDQRIAGAEHLCEGQKAWGRPPSPQVECTKRKIEVLLKVDGQLRHQKPHRAELTMGMVKGKVNYQVGLMFSCPASTASGCCMAMSAAAEQYAWACPVVFDNCCFVRSSMHITIAVCGEQASAWRGVGVCDNTSMSCAQRPTLMMNATKVDSLTTVPFHSYMKNMHIAHD